MVHEECNWKKDLEKDQDLQKREECIKWHMDMLEAR